MIHTLLLLLCDLLLMCMGVVIRSHALQGLFAVGDCCSQGKQSPVGLANFGTFWFVAPRTKLPVTGRFFKHFLSEARQDLQSAQQ